MEHERSYEVEYEDVSETVTQDVSLSLTEEQENAVFNSLAHEIHLCVKNGEIPDQVLHLTRRFEKQCAKHPPWIDTVGDERVYDVELTTWDSEILMYALTQAIFDPDVASVDEDVYYDVRKQIQEKTEYMRE